MDGGQTMNVALVFAGGSGQRMRNSAKPKQFLELYGKPIIIYTLEVFEKHPEIDTVVVPCSAHMASCLASGVSDSFNAVLHGYWSDAFCPCSFL